MLAYALVPEAMVAMITSFLACQIERDGGGAAGPGGGDNLEVGQSKEGGGPDTVGRGGADGGSGREGVERTRDVVGAVDARLEGKRANPGAADLHADARAIGSSDDDAAGIGGDGALDNGNR